VIQPLWKLSMAPPIHEEGDTVCEEPLITITDLKAAAWKQSRKAPLEIE